MNASDPKGSIGATKPQLWLIPPVAETSMANVLVLGATKYGVYNWRGTQVKASTYLSALKRHEQAYRSGEQTDPESGESHLAHIMANCAILLDAQVKGTLIHDLDTIEVKGTPEPTLWCVHTTGIDATQATPSKEVAEALAAEWNEQIARKTSDDPNEPRCKASARPWPYDAAQHAGYLKYWLLKGYSLPG